MLQGLHHVTALAGDGQRTLDFYSQFPGMRLVKRTVNFDDPATHHFYFGGAAGTPGTLLTFFAGFHRPARRGAGQVVAVTYACPAEEFERWGRHSQSYGTRFGEEVLGLPAPDGLALELVAGRGPAHLDSVTLCESDVEATAGFLATLGFGRVQAEGNRHRFELPGAAARIDLLHEPQAERGKMGAGGIHHVALRVQDEAEQLEWRDRLIAAGFHVSPVKDRFYFHSIYFREPGGVLFEIATDGPGFLIDERAEDLGSALCLPPWLEPVRESIEARLTPVPATQNEVPQPSLPTT